MGHVFGPHLAVVEALVVKILGVDVPPGGSLRWNRRLWRLVERGHLAWIGANAISLEPLRRRGYGPVRGLAVFLPLHGG